MLSKSTWQTRRKQSHTFECRIGLLNKQWRLTAGWAESGHEACSSKKCFGSCFQLVLSRSLYLPISPAVCGCGLTRIEHTGQKRAILRSGDLQVIGNGFNRPESYVQPGS